MSDLRIEYPSIGATYYEEVFGVYEYRIYPESSVNAGQVQRLFLDSFTTLDEAQRAYPDAVRVDSTGYIPYTGPTHPCWGADDDLFYDDFEVPMHPSDAENFGW